MQDLSLYFLYPPFPWSAYMQPTTITCCFHARFPPHKTQSYLQVTFLQSSIYPLSTGYYFYIMLIMFDISEHLSLSCMILIAYIQEWSGLWCGQPYDAVHPLLTKGVSGGMWPCWHPLPPSGLWPGLLFNSQWILNGKAPTVESTLDTTWISMLLVLTE